MADEKNVSNGQDVTKVVDEKTKQTRTSRADAAKKTLEDSLYKLLKNNSNIEAIKIIFDSIIVALPDDNINYNILSIDKLIEAKSELTNKIKEIDAAITARAKSANK